MTRFEQELSGALGAFWKASAEKQIQQMEEQKDQILFGADGVVRWKSNNRVLPEECREILSHTTLKDLFSEEASRAAEDAETLAFLEGYSHRASEEEISEMRAAFGEGATVVDVISGERFRF